MAAWRREPLLPDWQKKRGGLFPFLGSDPLGSRRTATPASLQPAASFSFRGRPRPLHRRSRRSLKGVRSLRFHIRHKERSGTDGLPHLPGGKNKYIVKRLIMIFKNRSGNTFDIPTMASLSQKAPQIERILKKASKTHKQRVEDFNRHLDTLTEHYDIPKVSWTK
ncbi:hypothetical protein JRQ81_008792 [Phrynocephalus forsythii]|uniref:Protein FAM32A n=1 Tax=Phrynocephalus forsythii TaxID=171643 RepID=A0A9Q0XAP3_9SAUR|nr:hypothetical protein JRQ81_008792 [Phrynocephalus forsythii]